MYDRLVCNEYIPYICWYVFIDQQHLSQYIPQYMPKQRFERK